MVHVLQITQNLVISRFCFAKKCTKNYNARAQLLFCSLKLLFSDVAVAVMVFLNSLMLKLPNFFYVTRLQGIMVVVRFSIQLPWFHAGASYYKTRLQGIMVVVRFSIQLPWFHAGASYYKTRLQGIMVVVRFWIQLPWFHAGASYYKTRLEGIMVVVRSWMQLPWFLAGTSHYRTRLQRIIVIVFIKTNLQSKMMNITTMIPCRRISHSKLPIVVSFIHSPNQG